MRPLATKHHQALLRVPGVCTVRRLPDPARVVAATRPGFLESRGLLQKLDHRSCSRLKAGLLKRVGAGGDCVLVCPIIARGEREQRGDKEGASGSLQSDSSSRR